MFILDTDFLISYFDNNQSTHNKAVKILENFGREVAILSNLVKQELVTALSYKFNYEQAREVLKNIEYFNLQRVFLDLDQTKQIWNIYWEFKKKNISFVNCSNLFLSKKLTCKIASFDKFYGNNLF
jgi:predicted nucleic acid-binding protein